MMNPNEVSQSKEKEVFLSSDSTLFDSNSAEGSFPCFVSHQPGQASLEAARNYNNTGTDTGTTKILFYSSLKKCLALHQEWLRRTIEDAVVRCGQDSTDDIVVAYISGNSPDMLMSVLSCSSPELNPAIPALLNTRWTPSEMMASLRSRKKNNKTSSSTRNVITIVLHDDSGPFRNAALQVSNGLTHTENQYTCYLPIPNFSHNFFKLATETRTGKKSRLPNHDESHSFHTQMETCLQKASTRDALILFTSGTTGGSKGVRLSHRSLLVQALAKLDDPCRYSGATAMLATTVPLFHVGGFSSFLAVLLARGHFIFPAREGRTSGSKFQVQDISKSLRDPYLPSNTLVVVPAMLSSFFDKEIKAGLNRKRFLKARLLLIGGQSISREILEQCRHYFPNARIVQTYACTEAASSMTYLSLTTNNTQTPVASAPTSSQPIGSCVGSPPSHVELEICRKPSQQQGTSAAFKHETITKPFELGLIATKGPHVMNGYWERGGRSSIANRNDNRWFIGSDLGFWDDKGRLCFAGRAKDVVRTGGETVLAREVEQILLNHPDIAECAIFPRIDRRYGEAVACAIATRQTDMTIGTLKKWCQRKGLAGYKQPKYLFLVNSLPRNSSGKVLKHKLVAKFGNTELRSKL